MIKIFNYEDLVLNFKYILHFRMNSLHLGQLSACIQMSETLHKISAFSSFIATLCNLFSTSSLIKNFDPLRYSFNLNHIRIKLY